MTFRRHSWHGSWHWALPGLLLLAGCGGGKPTVPLPNPLNQAPHARVTAAVTSGDSPWTITFDASASSDSDGTIANYRWDYEGDGVYDVQTTVPKVVRLTTKSGRFTVHLIVTDNAGGQDAATADYVVGGGSGWQVVTVDSFATVDGVRDTDGARTALAVIGGNPSIAYGGNVLHYAHSSTPLGDKAADWAHTTIVSDSGQGTQRVQVGSMLAVVGDAAIAFSNFKLHYVRSLSTTGLEPDDWKALALNSDGPLRSVSMAIVGGRPAIAYVKAGTDPVAPDYTSDVLGFFHANSSDGIQTNDWQTPIALKAPAENTGYDGVSLLEVKGAGALAFSSFSHDTAAGLHTVELDFATAATPDGLLSTDWTFTTLQSRQYHDGDNQGVAFGRPSFAIVDGFPALACFVKNWSLGTDLLHVNELDELLYTRAADDAGAGPWTVLPLDTVQRSFVLAAAGDPLRLPQSAPSLSPLEGHPGLAYPPQLALSGTTDGLAAADWQTQAIEAGFGVSLADVGGQPALSYFTASGGTNSTTTVKYAVYVP